MRLMSLSFGIRMRHWGLGRRQSSLALLNRDLALQQLIRLIPGTRHLDKLTVAHPSGAPVPLRRESALTHTRCPFPPLMYSRQTKLGLGIGIPKQQTLRLEAISTPRKSA